MRVLVSGLMIVVDVPVLMTRVSVAKLVVMLMLTVMRLLVRGVQVVV
jgi:hypothetical protein